MSEIHGTIKLSEVTNSNDAPKRARLTGEQAVERLPKFVRVGPFDYAIEHLPEIEVERHSRWGDCWPGQFVIRIAPSIPTAVKVADTFLHEVTHAIFAVMNIEEGDKQERVVAAIGTGLAQVYRDNPWLLSWLAECLW